MATSCDPRYVEGWEGSLAGLPCIDGKALGKQCSTSLTAQKARLYTTILRPATHSPARTSKHSSSKSKKKRKPEFSSLWFTPHHDPHHSRVLFRSRAGRDCSSYPSQRRATIVRPQFPILSRFGLAEFPTCVVKTENLPRPLSMTSFKPSFNHEHSASHRPLVLSTPNN